jgi:hypothetical protein
MGVVLTLFDVVPRGGDQLVEDPWIFHPIDSERLPGAKLHIEIHPLGLNLVIDL